VRAFERQGFTAQARAPGRAKPADHPAARKARALWISLGLLGAVRDPSDKALEAFARRQVGCDRLQWANQQLVYKLVEALKAMAERAGWDQSLEGVAPTAVTLVLKRRLCGALLEKLADAGLAPDDWSVPRAAWEFAGIEVRDMNLLSAEELDLVARSLGATLAGRRP
jgi:hypothetical protein